jgi:hypothetical protein
MQINTNDGGAHAIIISGFRSRGGKHIAANFKKGGGGNPILNNYRESQFPEGRGSAKAPPGPLK